MIRHFVAIIFFIASALYAANEPLKVNFERDVVYGKAGDVDLKLDLARPAGDGPFPCIVFIHGGAWAGGSKSGYDGAIQEFAKKGYVAATVEYRFAPKYKFPAQVEDVKCAVRYLRAHAKELHINPEKFGALGDSAGGHLALMLDLMNKEDGCEGSAGCADQSSKVQCVVNYYGPCDFKNHGPRNAISDLLFLNFLGTLDESAPIVKQASPATYMDKTDGAILTFHGDKDPLVPIEMAQAFHEGLKKCGVEEKLEIMTGQAHGWGGAIHEKTTKEALEFFDKHLKN